MKNKKTLLGKVKIEAPKKLLSVQEKKDWQLRVRTDGWLKRFIDSMEGLGVGAKLEVSLVDPKTEEKVVSETLTTKFYRKERKE